MVHLVISGQLKTACGIDPEKQQIEGSKNIENVTCPDCIAITAAKSKPAKGSENAEQKNPAAAETASDKKADSETEKPAENVESEKKAEPAKEDDFAAKVIAGVALEADEVVDKIFGEFNAALERDTARLKLQTETLDCLQRMADTLGDIATALSKG